MIGEDRSREVLDFDLSDLSQQDYRGKRPGLYIVLAVIIGLTVESILLTLPRWSDLVQHGLRSAGGEVFIFGLTLTVVIVAIMCLGIARFFAGAETLRVDDTGVYLRYPGRASDSFEWNDYRKEMILHDFRQSPRRMRTNTAFFLFVRWGRSSALSEPAFDSILAKARSRGADIRTYNGRAFWYGQSPVIYRIRGHAHGPE
jgi:hypothetical protein